MPGIKIQSSICRWLVCTWLAIVGQTTAVHAETVSVDLKELQLALESANSDGDAVAKELLDKISVAINESNLGFVDGELLYSDSDSDITVEGGCNRTVILQISTDIVIESNTSLSLTLDSLYDPIVLDLNVSANVHSEGVARQILGVRLGSCQNLVRDSFSFDADGPAKFSLSASLDLNPEWTNETTLSLYPELTLDGELLEFSSKVNVDDTVLAGVLESYIEDRVSDIFNNSRLTSELATFERESNEKIEQSLDNGRIDIELPESSDEQILALYQLLQPDARFPITLDMIRRNRQQLLSSLLFGAPTSVNAILADAILCESAASFLSPINTESQLPSNYRASTVGEYCDVALDPNRLGNAASMPEELGQWTHSPGSRFDISALSVAGKTQPFMRRFAYKRVQTSRGMCELEMRVYSSSANPSMQKPLMALHGGSWQHRASGYIGIEATATHFTNEGFVVFAPFYRLIGESDGNIACNNASLADILIDVNDALDWIQLQSAELGLVGTTTLFGQSAGGHLALSLSVNRPQDVRRAILFYTPSDFEDFARQIKSEDYSNPAGLKILEAVTGSSIEELALSSALVQENSFPLAISKEPNSYPPMFIMHGEMDSLLPFRQSVRLCNAIDGSADFNVGAASLVPNLSTLKSVSMCGANGSQLHLIAEGDHALDLCLAPGLCLSGGEQSAKLVSQSMQRMLDWSSAESVAFEPDRSGIGAVYCSILTLLLFCWVRRFKLGDH